MDSPSFFEDSVAHVEGFPSTFLVGCHYFQQALYDKAKDNFTKIIASNNKTLYYEARFNMGACLFKMADFKQALKQFTQLMNEQKASSKASVSNFMSKDLKQDQVFKQFYGRDRRLYYNKALCELQMGLFDQAITTCKQYIQPIKQVTRKVVQLENQA